MTPGKLKRAVLLELDKRLSSEGFQRSSDEFFGDRYDRWEGQVRQSFTPSLVPRKDRFELDVPFVSVRFEPAEELVAKYEQRPAFVSADDTRARATLGMRLEPKGLKSLVGKHWVITEESQARDCVEQYLAYSLPQANQFWKKFSDPDETLKVLAGTNAPFEYPVPPAMKAKSAIALAITTRPAKAREMIDLMAQKLPDESARQEVNQWIEKASEIRGETAWRDSPIV